MHPELERLIQLQQLHNTADRLQRRVNDIPERQAGLDARLAELHLALTGARERLTASQAARRDIERDAATAQSRLSKYKDQLMEVKTNKEYQAMQKEITTVEREIRTLEDRILDRMEEAEEINAAVKKAEIALKAEEAEVVRERAELETVRTSLTGELEQTNAARDALTRQIEASALALFTSLAQRRGQAVVEARGGHCSVCHVRLRPQVFNEVRRNDSLIQCESCQRILYFSPAAPSGVPQQT